VNDVPNLGPDLEQTDAPFTPEMLEHARKLFAGHVGFLKSAPTLEFLPDASVPEVAFAGRSNVGKSSRSARRSRSASSTCLATALPRHPRTSSRNGAS
jgi:hypothetical protein